MTARILSGDVFDLLPTIPKGSVDVCVTSPPYWRLRAYLAKDHPLKHLELGSEKTPKEYVANMVRVFALVRDCLADHGTVWLNCGDTYSGGTMGRADAGYSGGAKDAARIGISRPPVECIDAGQLCLIPQRLAIALQDDGWLVRSIVIWRKPAPMPQSVSGWRWERHRVKVAPRGSSKSKAPHGQRNPDSCRNPDLQAKWKNCPGCKKCNPNGGYVLRRGSWRPTSSYEPILMLAKSDRYFCDGEPVKTAPAEATVSRDQYTRVLDDPDEQFAVRHDHETVCDGANARDVQEWAAEPLKSKHYAAYPTALVQWCLRAATSAKGYCPMCGKPWCRVIESEPVPHPEPRANGRAEVDTRGGNQGNGSAALAPKVTTTGWRPTCNCIGADSVDPRPALVLDPFCGSGRTAVAAQRMCLDFIGCELNPEYVEMARGILSEASPLFASVEA